jgi:isoleucyl-tRNA synthetase
MFKPVNTKINFPQLEEETLKYWKENKIFEKSVDQRPENKRWTFLDGPPFVTGVPHYGSLLSSLPKDLFGRYWTMKGYRVRRVWGWDGHGLPIENKVEGALDLKSKKDIEEKIGVKKFIEECRKYVGQVSAEWEWYVDHIGRWVDFSHAYKTWDKDYMESVMWVFKQMYDKDFVYKDLRVALYCPHCATPISNFEIAMDADNYKDMSDPATTYKYKLVNFNSDKLEGENNTYLLAWSTTPWTKIVTPALAVNPDLDYVRVEQNSENYILAKGALKILGDSKTYKILETFKGEKIVGKKFQPHYDYFKNKAKNGEKIFEVIPGKFVTEEEGAGVVTMAAYGVEDLKAMKENSIHIETHLDEEGNVFEDVPIFGGMYYLKANKAVNEDLHSRNLIYKDDQTTHSVPLCWRCHTRLYYTAIDAWFVNVQKLKPLMKKTNEEINWFPKHFKHGRFLKSMENAPDWNISRNRYWGSPIPVWECEDCHERFVPGSISELENASGSKIADLHKPEIDEVFVKCRKCSGKSIRTPEVLDSWIEAGSASFAERHFPFSDENLENFFPPDFIAEYTGQIRAWFYVLHVIGAALYESRAFKNVMVEGVILGTDGRKMSKNYGNYPDPREMIGKYGGDALRLYLMGSPVMNGEDILISEDNYKMQVRGMMLILWNTYNFFVSYANVDNWSLSSGKTSSKNVLDKWILSLLNNLIKNVTQDLDSYDTVNTIDKLQKFINEFSTWYIRRSRDRVGLSAEDTDDKSLFYQTAHEVLTVLSKLLAPIVPFIAEEIYRGLTNSESVHLANWPVVDETSIDNNLEVQMKLARGAVEAGHAFRKTNNLKLKTPLGRIELNLEGEYERVWEDVWDIALEELNIKNLIVNSKVRFPKEEVKVSEEDLTKEGEARDIVRNIQAERKALGTSLDEKVNVVLENWPEEFESEIKRKALVENLEKGIFTVKKLGS